MEEMYEVDSDGDLMVILPLPPAPVPFTLWRGWDGELPAHTNNGEAMDGEELASNEVAPFTKPTIAGPELKIKVSSKHLCLASRYFRKMLRGQWMEATTIYPNGCRQVILERFDAGAFKLLMEVLHLRGAKISRSVDLDMMAKIAVLVDYFECVEAMGLISDMWITALSKHKDDRELILLIVIASVFHQPGLFKTATRSVIFKSTGPIPTLGLPIHDRDVMCMIRVRIGKFNGAADEIDARRENLLAEFFLSFDKLIDDLCLGKKGCSFDCQSMIVGAITKQMRMRKWHPRPLSPYLEISVRDAYEALWDLRIRNELHYSGSIQDRPVVCGLQELFHPILDNFEAWHIRSRLEGDSGVSRSRDSCRKDV